MACLIVRSIDRFGRQSGDAPTVDTRTTKTTADEELSFGSFRHLISLRLSVIVRREERWIGLIPTATTNWATFDGLRRRSRRITAAQPIVPATQRFSTLGAGAATTAKLICAEQSIGCCRSNC